MYLKEEKIQSIISSYGIKTMSKWVVVDGGVNESETARLWANQSFTAVGVCSSHHLFTHWKHVPLNRHLVHLLPFWFFFLSVSRDKSIALLDIREKQDLVKQIKIKQLKFTSWTQTRKEKKRKKKKKPNSQKQKLK